MKSILVLVVTVLLLNLTACSYVRGYFPDKERDYQLTAEIPPLKVPTDIANSKLEKTVSSQPLAEKTEAVGVIGEVVKAVPATKTTPVTDTPTVEDTPREPVYADLVKFDSGEMRLRINKTLATSWRAVSKALTHKAIEITARDQANAEFVVQYDPNASDFKDESIWDELSFVFADDLSKEKPYHLKLVAADQNTELVVLDENNKPATEEAALSLLKLLSATMNADREQ
jgi:outer membrane protein assembly factor BamC